MKEKEKTSKSMKDRKDVKESIKKKKNAHNQTISK